MLSLSHSKIVLTLLAGFFLAPVVYASNNNRELITSKRGRRNKWNKVNFNTPEEAPQSTITPAEAAKNNAAAGLLEWRRLEAFIKVTEGETTYDESHIQRIRTATEKRTAAIQQKLDMRVQKLTAQKNQITEEAQKQIAEIQEKRAKRDNIRQEAFAKRIALLASLATAERTLLRHNSSDHQQLATELNTILSNDTNAQILTSGNIVRATQNIGQSADQETSSAHQIFYGPEKQATEPTDNSQASSPTLAPTTPASQESQGWYDWFFGNTPAPATTPAAPTQTA